MPRNSFYFWYNKQFYDDFIDFSKKNRSHFNFLKLSKNLKIELAANKKKVSKKLLITRKNPFLMNFRLFGLHLKAFLLPECSKISGQS